MSATYEIIDGVRRAKAAQLEGHVAIPARLYGSGGGKFLREFDVPMESLRSPHKNSILRVSAGDEARWSRVTEGARQIPLPFPPIEIVEGGSRGSCRRYYICWEQRLMIQPDKLPQALRALNSILVRARWMARENGEVELAELLDAVEILPRLIAQAEDRTADFEAILQDISKRHESCEEVVEEYQHLPARSE